MSNQEQQMQLRHLINEMIRLMNENDILESANIMADDILIVKQCGNALKKKEWVNLYGSQYNLHSNKLMDIYNITISEDTCMGYVCYSTHTTFTNNNKYNDNKALNIAIFKKVDKKWKMSYLQSSSSNIIY